MLYQVTASIPWADSVGFGDVILNIYGRGSEMICEIVRFAIKSGMSRDDVLVDARTVVERWQGEKDLVRKHFLFDGEKEALGIYFWLNRESAEAAHNEQWRQRVMDIHGSVPHIEYHDTVMIVDNTDGSVTEYS
jgi:hypothetical protein